MPRDRSAIHIHAHDAAPTVRKGLRCASGMLLALLAMFPAFAGTQAAAAEDGLRPGEFMWAPELAPEGPVSVLVSLPLQRVYVYRNGVRIGISTASTGKPGHDTPSGVYTILQKRREHYSNLYDDAPMPFMQRLTWGGVALHAGHLPGYPASHGCVRLPLAFAEHLFATTGLGTTVVVADAETFPPSIVSPGFLLSDATPHWATDQGAPTASIAGWFPERAPDGPLTILISTTDGEIVVLRNAIEIGRAAVMVDASDASLTAIGTHAYLLLEGALEQPSLAVPDRPALRWQSLPMSRDAGVSDDALRTAFETGRIAVPADFARAAYESLRPGTMLIITGERLQPRDGSVDVLTTEDDHPR